MKELKAKQAFISLYAAARQVLKNNNKETMRRLEIAVENVDEIADRCRANNPAEVCENDTMSL